MGIARRVSACAVALGAGLLLPANVPAAAYPGNVCVSTKMKLAGNYCRDVLKAWSIWNRTQDATDRDARIARAATKLNDKWARADAKALAQRVYCSETTPAPAAMTAQLDAAVGPVITAVNTGLDLGDRQQAKCGAALLIAAAKKCRAFLVAEGKWVRRLDKDPDAAVRNARRSLASQRFSRAWARATAASCPTSATEGGVEALVDGLSDDAIFVTTVSPNVSDTSFDIIPGVTTIYEKRTLAPTCSRSTPYSFFAKRGTVNKLLMYYQGGGACWDYLTCEAVGTFDENVNTGGGDNPNLTSHFGFDDLSNPSNPFRDWNIVFVPYCSGDVHLGDARATYTDGPNSVVIQHRGFVNARVAEKWAREHFVNPEQLFVTGSSAGAYGALLHGAWLHRAYPASDISVLGDAGNGVITEDFRQNNFPSWNVYPNLPPDIPGLVDLTVPELSELAANYYPQSKWAHYTSAYDGGLGGQTGFYNVMLNPGNIFAWPSWWNASCAWNSVMRAQAIQAASLAPDNYRYYIGTGSAHTMFGHPKVYNDTTGGVPTIVDWINAMLSDSPAWTNVECTNCGLLLPGDPRPSPLQSPFAQVGPDVVITCP
jgi:hypothetical protein